MKAHHKNFLKTILKNRQTILGTKFHEFDFLCYDEYVVFKELFYHNYSNYAVLFTEQEFDALLEKMQPFTRIIDPQFDEYFALLDACYFI